MASKTIQQINESAESLQLAVQILLSNPTTNRSYRNRLAYFLINQLENSDFEILNSLTIQGKARFLSARFDRKVAGPLGPSGSRRSE